MNSAQRVIAKFGGQKPLAELLGKTPSTVSYWVKAGTIPAKWQRKILDLAKEYGIELYPGDFIDILDRDGNAIGEDALVVPVAQWPGVLKIGSMELEVYVLSDGRRVISRAGATYLLSGIKGGDLDSYIGVESLRDYLSANLDEQFFDFQIPQVVNKKVQGMPAETFLDICTAYMRALDDDALKTERQKKIAIKAGMFIAACAKLGLVAMIDEATGYQYIRAEDALQFKLRLYLEDEMRKWESTFPDELWREFGRLTHWKGTITQRPKYWGKLVMELVYEYLDPDVAKWLKEHNPHPQKGQNHHQWLSSQYGLKKLTEHMWMLIGLAKSCETMPELKLKMAQIYGRQPIQLILYLPPLSPHARDIDNQSA